MAKGNHQGSGSIPEENLTRRREGAKKRSRENNVRLLFRGFAASRASLLFDICLLPFPQFSRSRLCRLATPGNNENRSEYRLQAVRLIHKRT
ncbi:MAG: hypothetical protein ACKVX9_08650, partial [Blastocatellia bacterium]